MVNKLVRLCFIIILFVTVVPFLSDTTEDVNITGNDDFTLISEDKVNITWTPTDLTKGIIPLADTKVNIALVRSNIH